jgi:DNA-binding CsgD family transcriptional regulator/N-acetylneuraminic acid mutarotase
MSRKGILRCYNFINMANVEINELSERELDILKLVATGASNKEIAQKLFISSNTVKVHLRNIFTKIGASSRTEAAMFAVRVGLIESAKNPTPLIIDSQQSGTTQMVDAALQPSALPGEVIPSRPTRFPRWAAYIAVTGILGLILLGLKLSPGLAIFSYPTSTAAPQNTPTPFPHWKKMASMPTPRSNSAVTAYANQIYVIGGMNTQGALGSTDRYNPQVDDWTSLASKPVPVYNASAAVINGLIYVPGGSLTLDNTQLTNILEIYDTDTGLWSTGASLPVPLSEYGIVAYEGILYVFGGWDGKAERNTVYAYDPPLDAWEARASMPTARAFCGVAEAAGKIYVIGGVNAGQPVGANENYTPSKDNRGSNPWSSGFPLPEDRSGVQAATIADTIYVFGGDAGHTNRVGLIYFPQNDSWQSLEASPISLGDGFGLTSIGTNLFFEGGKIGTLFSDQNLSYQAIITFSIPIIIK